MPSTDTFEDFNIDIDEIIDILNTHEIKIERPSQLQQIPRRSGDRRNPTQQRKDFSYRNHSTRSLENRRYGDYYKPYTPKNSTKESRYESSSIDSLKDEVDDSDILEQVKRVRGGG